MSEIACTCVKKTFVFVGGSLRQRHRKGCPKDGVPGLFRAFGLTRESLTPMATMIAEFSARLASACALPGWLVRGEPEPVALVKVER